MTYFVQIGKEEFKITGANSKAEASKMARNFIANRAKCERQEAQYKRTGKIPH